MIRVVNDPCEATMSDHPSSAQHPPVTATELALADIWGQALGLPAVGGLDNFFDLGGHSLLIHMVHDGIAQRLGKNPPVVELFKYPTIRALADSLAGGARAGGRPRLARQLARRRPPPVRDTDPRRAR